MNRDGSDPHKVTSADASSGDSDPAWSPDGGRIAFSSSRGNGNWHVWIVDLATGSLSQLTPGWGTSPAWSPNGSRIAYDAGGTIHVVDATGANDYRLTGCTCTGPEGSPTWSRDGNYLVFGRYDDDWQSTNTRQLYFVRATGGEGVPITTGAYYHDHPTFSPDGSLVAFQRQDGATGNPGIYVMSLGDLVPHQAVTGPGRNFAPSWGASFAGTDVTPPTITLTRPTSATDRIDVYTVGELVLADYSCSDSESGIRHCEGSAPSGEPIDTRFIGTYEFTVFAADQAGNPVYKRTHYSVVFPFEGFASPISSGGLTESKAGDGVPLKFSLHGAYGLDAVTGTTQQPIDCATRTALDAAQAAGGTLSYNSAQDRYLFAWSTVKSWAGSCRAVTIALRDGTTHRADVHFTK
jgi:dipeptidyl aminopeptidase/acylaminoacyl peptidase